MATTEARDHGLPPLEGINRLYGTGVIISQDVYTEIAGQFVCRPLDIVAVKGKQQSIKIYELVAELADSPPGELVRFHELFEQGFAAFERFYQWFLGNPGMEFQ